MKLWPLPLPSSLKHVGREGDLQKILGVAQLAASCLVLLLPPVPRPSEGRLSSLTRPGAWPRSRPSSRWSPGKQE